MCRTSEMNMEEEKEVWIAILNAFFGISEKTAREECEKKWMFKAHSAVRIHSTNHMTLSALIDKWSKSHTDEAWDAWYEPFLEKGEIFRPYLDDIRQHKEKRMLARKKLKQQLATLLSDEDDMLKQCLQHKGGKKS